MIRNIQFFVCLLLIASITLSGCGFIRIGEDEPEEVALSVNEVLQKSQNVMDTLAGYHIVTKGQINQTMQEISGTQNNQFSFEFDQKFTNQPPALYSIQKEFKQNGSSTTRELYIVNGVAYTNVGSRWIRSTQPSTKITLSQNPPDFLRFALQANGQGIHIQKVDGAYRLTLNQTAGKGFLLQFFNEAIQSFQAQGITLSENDFRVEKFQQQIWIDENTFKFRKMTTNLDYTVQYNGRTLKSAGNLQVDYQGDYNSQIVVPSNVLNSVGN